MAIEYLSIKIGGKSISYRHDGPKNGPALVFIAGWPLPGFQNPKILDNVVGALGEIGFNVYSPDLPGLFRSDSIDSGWSAGDYVDFVENFIISLKINDFILAGQSFGGRLAALYALKYQNAESLKGLVLINPATFSSSEEGKRLGSIHFYHRTINRAARFLLSLKVFPRKLKLFLIQNFTGFPANMEFNQKLEDRAETLEFFINFPSNRKPYDFSKIKTPTLLLWGVPDISLPKRLAMMLDREILNSKLVTLRGGHTAMYKHPQKAAEIIWGFYNSRVGKPSAGEKTL